MHRRKYLHFQLNYIQLFYYQVKFGMIAYPVLTEDCVGYSRCAWNSRITIAKIVFCHLITIQLGSEFEGYPEQWLYLSRCMAMLIC